MVITEQPLPRSPGSYSGFGGLTNHHHNRVICIEAVLPAAGILSYPLSILLPLLGSDDIESRIAQHKLNFINSMANLDDDALAKKLLLARAEDPSAEGLIANLRQLADNSNLPSIATLLKEITPNNQLSPADTSCKPCSASVEDVYHFIAVCSSLREERMSLIADASPTVSIHLPDPGTRPEEFTNVILETNWIDVQEVQVFSIEYLRQLMTHRITKLRTGP